VKEVLNEEIQPTCREVLVMIGGKTTGHRRSTETGVGVKIKSSCRNGRFGSGDSGYVMKTNRASRVEAVLRSAE